MEKLPFDIDRYVVEFVLNTELKVLKFKNLKINQSSIFFIGFLSRTATHSNIISTFQEVSFQFRSKHI